MMVFARSRFIRAWLALIPAVMYSPNAGAQDMGENNVSLISPMPGTEVVAKRPVIAIKSGFSLLEGEGIVLLDGNDITALLTRKDDVYSFTPLDHLSSGHHSVYVITFDDQGGERAQELVFTSRHSESFAEVYSKNTLSATQKTVLTRDKSESGEGLYSTDEEFPYASFDSYLSTDSFLKEGGFDGSARANFRYYDQNAALLEPEKKGLRVLDFLIAANYSGENYSSLLELGDTTIEESRNTLDYLTRRGARVSLRSGSYTINGFSVLGEETGYEIEGVGLGFNSNDHIMGSSIQGSFYNSQLKIKGIYIRGGQEGEFFGTWSESPGRKGDVYGILITSDFFDQQFLTDFEFDASSFDNNTGDDLGEEDDIAYRIKFSGRKSVYEYEASYSYTGPEYEVVGNQNIVKDWAGFNLQGGVIYPENILRAFINYSWDNLEDDAFLARIYSLTGNLEYQYLGWQRFPVSLLLEYNTQESEDEPAGFEPTSLDTYNLTGKISYIEGPWGVEVRSSFSEQNDKSIFDADTELFTFEFIPSYTGYRFSVLPSWTYNRSKDLLSDVCTDTNTLTLDVYSSFLSDTIIGEAGGTYDWTEADDNSIDMNNTALYAKLSYRFMDLWQLEDSTIALEYHYKRQEDEVFDATYRENTLTLVFSTALPYKF